MNITGLGGGVILDDEHLAMMMSHSADARSCVLATLVAPEVVEKWLDFTDKTNISVHVSGDRAMTEDICRNTQYCERAFPQFANNRSPELESRFQKLVLETERN